MNPTCPSPDRLDAWLDGLLPTEEAAIFEAHLTTCAVCAAEVALARRLQTALHDLPAEPCPDEVYNAALERIAALDRQAPNRQPVAGPRKVRLRRAAWVALPLALALALAVFLWPRLRPAPEAEYTAAEIEAARAEVEYALALVSEVGRETGVFLQEDVLAPHVVEPVQESLNLKD
ncbi:MAG TPA: zf-HC2 domain-containing protein [Rubricoccaceae bacterium]|nr:zf-HC2 domain-containing protein [Rubricoccaceae bacterium]